MHSMDGDSESGFEGRNMALFEVSGAFCRQQDEVRGRGHGPPSPGGSTESGQGCPPDWTVSGRRPRGQNLPVRAWGPLGGAGAWGP